MDSELLASSWTMVIPGPIGRINKDFLAESPSHF